MFFLQKFYCVWLGDGEGKHEFKVRNVNLNTCHAYVASQRTLAQAVDGNEIFLRVKASTKFKNGHYVASRNLLKFCVCSFILIYFMLFLSRFWLDDSKWEFLQPVILVRVCLGNILLCLVHLSSRSCNICRWNWRGTLHSTWLQCVYQIIYHDDVRHGCRLIWHGGEL